MYKHSSYGRRQNQYETGDDPVGLPVRSKPSYKDGGYEVSYDDMIQPCRSCEETVITEAETTDFTEGSTVMTEMSESSMSFLYAKIRELETQSRNSEQQVQELKSWLEETEEELAMERLLRSNSESSPGDQNAQQPPHLLPRLQKSEIEINNLKEDNREMKRCLQGTLQELAIEKQSNQYLSRRVKKMEKQMKEIVEMVCWRSEV